MPRTVPIDDPQPSQPYVDAGRLRDALAWFDVDDPSYDPLPVLRLDGDLVLSDGHTRAFLASLAGAETLTVVDDPDRRDLDAALYRTCVRWTREACVTRVDDLVGRVVSPGTFEERWVARCRDAAE